jgi:hypothetical protein
LRRELQWTQRLLESTRHRAFAELAVNPAIDDAMTDCAFSVFRAAVRRRPTDTLAARTH